MREREREREQSQTSHGTGTVGKSRTILPPSRLFKLNLQFFGSLANDSQTTQSSERKERNFSKNTELISREQSVVFPAFTKEELIKINATQLTLIEELGIGTEREKCLINNCSDNNLPPSPLCLGHTAGALDYLENYGKQKKNKRWVKEQKTHRRLADCTAKIARKLEKLRIGETELQTLKSELRKKSQERREIIQQKWAEFLHISNRGEIFLFQTSQQKIFPLSDY